MTQNRVRAHRNHALGRTGDPDVIDIDGGRQSLLMLFLGVLVFTLVIVITAVDLIAWSEPNTAFSLSARTTQFLDVAAHASCETFWKVPGYLAALFSQLIPHLHHVCMPQVSP